MKNFYQAGWSCGLVPFLSIGSSVGWHFFSFRRVFQFYPEPKIRHCIQCNICVYGNHFRSSAALLFGLHGFPFGGWGLGSGVVALLQRHSLITEHVYPVEHARE